MPEEKFYLLLLALRRREIESNELSKLGRNQIVFDPDIRGNWISKFFTNLLFLIRNGLPHFNLEKWIRTSAIWTVWINKVKLLEKNESLCFFLRFKDESQQPAGNQRSGVPTLNVKFLRVCEEKENVQTQGRRHILAWINRLSDQSMKSMAQFFEFFDSPSEIDSRIATCDVTNFELRQLAFINKLIGSLFTSSIY